MQVACLCPTDTFDYASIIEEIVRERTGEDADFSRFRPHRDEIPESLEWDAVVVTGSEYHVYDRQRWVEASELFLRFALESETPVLGICYGHQLLADTLGGVVAEMDEREMGYREVAVTDRGRASGLFDGLDERFRSFSSHLDHVRELPDEAHVLAENEYGVQAFRSGRFPAWGIQFHPEYSREMADELLSNKDMGEDERKAIRSTFTDDNVAAAERSRRVFDAFFERV
jgi:GMP synthase (glutamine-hydrolysing)